MQLVYQEIYDSLTAMVPQGSVFEIRMLGTRKGQIDSGYFDDLAQAATALVSSEGFYKGIYFTPNPVTRDALARSYNRIAPWSQITTHDTEINKRKWLLVDIDPIRPAGISSTDAEHLKAIEKGRTIAGMLTFSYGWCAPMISSSGNGCHLMYPIDEENTTEVRDEIQTFLQSLKHQFKDDRIDIDTSVFNAARIWRLPGTWARKGDHIPERPHRKAQIIQPITHLSRVSLLQLIRYNHDHKDHVPARPGQPGSTSRRQMEYPQDEAAFKRLNIAALAHLAMWVPDVFPAAREYNGGYRVSAEDLGEGYEEALTIHPLPLGIKHFGPADQGHTTEGRYTAVSLVAEYSGCDKVRAATRLGDLMQYPVNEFAALEITGQAVVAGHGGMEALLGTVQRFNFASIRSINDLQDIKFKEVKWILEKVLPTGNIMLAARPKMRKTWLALQLCIAIASGRKFLEWQANQGEVLFLALEDNERRIQNRIRTLQRMEIAPPDLSGFRYWTGGMDYKANGQLYISDPEEAARTLNAFPRGQAGVDALEQYLEHFPKTTTIVIDTLQHFKESSNDRDIYSRDYNAMTPITQLANRKNILIVPVTHEKKGLAGNISADFLEDVTGSAGITGGTDGVMSIKGRRGVQEENESRTLFLSGRDIPHDFSVDIQFDTDRGGWLTAARTDHKVAVITMLSRHPFLNQKDICALLPNIPQPRLLKALLELKMNGEIQQSKFGYSLTRG